MKTSAGQFSLLFDGDEDLPVEEPAVEHAHILWSYSRRETMERCPFAYYNKYYGASLKKAKGEPRKELLRTMKGLSSRHEQAGKILHLVISTFLKKAQKGEVWTHERLASWARDLYRRGLEHSRSYPLPSRFENEKYPPTLLMEFYYGFANAEELCAESEQSLLNALSNFFHVPEVAPFRDRGCQAGALVEEKVGFKGPHYTLTGQVDLAYLDASDGRAKVVDWKMGVASGNDDSLQLLSYAMVTQHKFGCAADAIDVYRVHLGDGQVSHYAVNRAELGRARARVLQDVERMQVLDSYGVRADSTVFTPCNQPRVCAGCVFQGLCSKEGM